MIVHKILKKDQKDFYLCNQAIFPILPRKSSFHWKFVTCKKCLSYKNLDTSNNLSLVRCLSCGQLQTKDLWMSKYYKKKERCCCLCGKRRFIKRTKNNDRYV